MSRPRGTDSAQIIQDGYYINDYKDGLSYWEVISQNQIGEGDMVLELREKPVGQIGDTTFYRRRLFFEEDIGKKIFNTREDAIRHPEV